VVPKDVSLIRGGYSEEDLALAKPLMLYPKLIRRKNSKSVSAKRWNKKARDVSYES